MQVKMDADPTNRPDAGFFDARRFLIRALRSGSCRAQPTAANLQSASGLLTSAPIFLYEAERRPAGLEARRGTRVHDRVTGGERERERKGTRHDNVKSAQPAPEATQINGRSAFLISSEIKTRFGASLNQIKPESTLGSPLEIIRHSTTQHGHGARSNPPRPPSDQPAPGDRPSPIDPKTPGTSPNTRGCPMQTEP